MPGTKSRSIDRLSLGSPRADRADLALTASRRWLRALVCALLAAALGACVSTIGPQLEGAAGADPGPFPDAYEQIVRTWIQQKFRTYAQVEAVRVPRPKPGFEKPPLLSMRATRYGWWTRVTFRATDRLGAPTGTIAYAVLIRHDAVVAHQKLVF
jgi:hypothetical protein